MRRKGSSLLELVVVVAIVAILAAVAVPSFSRWLAHARLQVAGTMLAQDFRDLQVHAVGEDCYYTIVFVTDENRYYYRPGTVSWTPPGAHRVERSLGGQAGFPLAMGKRVPVSAVFGPQTSLRTPVVAMSFNAMGRPAGTGGGHVTLMNRYDERVDVIVTPVDGLIRMEWVD